MFRLLKYMGSRPHKSSSPKPVVAWLLPLVFAVAIMTILATHAEETVNFGINDNGRAVVIGLHDSFSVRLPVQLGTGSSWQAASLPGILEREDMKFEGGEGVPGGTETQVFRFRSVNEGSGRLVLMNLRPWEQPGEAQGSFTLNVTVK